MIEAAIFDMDGLLVDSEPLWTLAEIEVFGSVGIALDEAECARTVGLAIDEVVALRFAERPWGGESQESVARRILDRVVALVGVRGEAMAGARSAVALARDRGAAVGLASSSAPELIDAVLARLGLEHAFDHVQSGMELRYGKPHPEIYLVAAERLGVEPTRCLAFEDSLPGLVAAKAARMLAVAVPERRLAGDPRYSLADLVLGSLEELDVGSWDRLGALVPPTAGPRVSTDRPVRA